MIDQILNKYINNERNIGFSHYSPDNIRKLLDILGNPQNKIKTIHIAGTNGKGTTCYLIAGILQNSGYNTGLFISPHLVRLNERISINSIEISDTELLYYIQKADKAANENKITVTYFDILTAAAFSFFNDKSVEIAVIETGLGGRLDSTNVILPELSIITDISMDHSHILGDSIEKITSEKCGIIKPGVPVITTNTDRNILRIIQKFSEDRKSELIEPGLSYVFKKLPSDNNRFKFIINYDNFQELIIETDLFPEHQIKNAAASAVAAMFLKNKILNAITPDSIKSTIKEIRIPGRFQKLSDKNNIYFDPAHNIASLSSIINGFKKLFPGLQLRIILTIMTDKITPDIQLLLEAEKDIIIYYLIEDPRAYIPVNQQFYLITHDRNIIIQELITDINNNRVILFTGTFRIYNFAVEIAEFLNEL